ncbi:hypothetical protein P8452_52887 [Trifolium repens]|nr:hypothetical protein P8452_52887 [Trifolium repens]
MVKLSLFLTIMELSLALAFYVLCYNIPRLTIINKSSSSIANLLYLLLIIISFASSFQVLGLFSAEPQQKWVLRNGVLR